MSIENPTTDAEVVSDHIVFFIHGMGQQTEKFGHLNTHVETMQRNTEDLLASHYPGQKARVKFIPIEWHSYVHGMLDNNLNRSTLRTVPKVRLVANEWAMDILIYFTKPYGQTIIDTCCQQMIAGYNGHVAEHPEFASNGTVHIIGFSLGGICAYDILSEQWEPEDGVPPWEEELPEEVTETSGPLLRRLDVTVPKLPFRVKSLFTCGSPIAATMLIRGFNFYTLRPPPRTGFFNIFHPFDPLGYRMEPMIDSDFYDVKPVRVERLARRRILPVPLPRIPNLGIKSSIGAAAPLIWQARRTFFRYMMTREGRLIVDSGVTQRTVVETVVDGHAGDDEGGEGGEDDDSDELEVRSEDGCREIEGTEEFSRSYDSLPETRDAAGTLRRPTLKKGSMSIRRASRGRIPAALRRRSSELMGSDESLDEEETWVNGEAAKVLYEEEEERVWTEETPVEAATWSRRWMGGGADGGAEKRRSYWYGGWTRRRSSTKIINGAAAVTTDGDNDAEAADQEEERDDEGDDEGEASLEEEEAMAWNIAKLVDSAGQEGQDGFEELLGDAVKSSVQPADAPQRRSTILGMAGSVAGSVASVAGSAASAALSVIGLSQPNSSETNIAKGPRVVPQPSTSSPAALGRKQKPRRSTKLSQERHGLSDSELAKVVGERPDVERADNASPDLLDGEEAAIEPPRTNNELTEVKLLDTDGDAVDSTDPVAPVNPVDSVNPVDPASPSVIPILETQLVLTPERTSSSETLVAEPTPERTSSSEILVAEPEVMDKESLGDILVTPSTPLVEYIDPIVTAHPHTKNLLSADNADVVSLAESDSSYATATSMDGHHEDILDAVPSSPDSGRTAMGSDDEMTLAKRSRSDDELSIGSGGAGALVLDGKDGRTYSRVDYVLTEGVVDAYASEWIVAMKSHFRYWANKDVNLFLLKAMVGCPTTVVKV